MSEVDGVVVAVPANDEEELLPRCLQSVAAAIRELAHEVPGVTTCVVVAADACTDRTAEVAAAEGALVVELDARLAGTARDAAIRAGLTQLGLPERRVWIANTDADSAVPPNWLTDQVRTAQAGADLIFGTVEPDDDAGPELLAQWHARHDLREGHDHLHGANLAMRASAWREHGGFGDLAVHEDAGLAWRIRGAGQPFVATDRTRVRTSARTANRVPGGFGGWLRRLAQEGVKSD